MPHDKEEKYVPFSEHVPLHCHSYYSILDGFCSTELMAQTAKKHGFPAIALTDHGTCAGLYSFYKDCHKVGVKPILGMEAYFVDDINIKEKGDVRLHLTLLAKNKIGYKNLIAMSSIANLKGFYSKPRIDLNVLKAHKEGIICGSACVHGIASYYILNNDVEKARSNLVLFKDLFGDDFYVEIMLHQYNDEKKTKDFKFVMKKLYELAQELGIMSVATCDSHYANKEDSKSHDVLLCISTKDTIKNKERFSFGSEDFYIKSFGEMMQKCPKNPAIVTNSVLIANKIEDGIIEVGKDLLPDFPLPPGETSESKYLKSLIIDGMKEKGFYDKPEYMDRFDEEMSVILGCHFEKYFLILWDVIAFARREGIRVGPGRGSGVASLCLYCLGVTQLDPIKHDLLFSRFLNKDRISPPDVDLDFDYMKQDQIFNYVRRKYGNDCTTRIGTYTSLKVKDAIRRVGKVLDVGGDFEDVDGKFSGSWKSGEKTLSIIGDICKVVPEKIIQADTPQEEFDKTLDSKNKEADALKEFRDQYPEVFSYARKVTGTLSAAGVHPAGIIACRDPIIDHVPLRLSGDAICTQYDMMEVEELGLLKFDFLALKTLTLIDHCLALIKANYTKVYDLNKLEPEDKDVFEMLTNGDTDGVFQFEGGGMTNLIQNLRIDSFNDMVVANALYRPGTLGAGIHTDYCDYKHGKKKIEYAHPAMKEVLSETYGMMIYQEGVMKVSKVIAGFNDVEADTFRKGIGKKDIDKINKLKHKFVSGCISNGSDKATAEKVFELCKNFSGYGFNKCLSGSTKIINKIDGKDYSLEELCLRKDLKVVLDSYLDGQTVEDEVIDVFETGEKEVYEIELSNGMKISCTFDHKFICSDGKPHTLRAILINDYEILCD